MKNSKLSETWFKYEFDKAALHCIVLHKNRNELLKAMAFIIVDKYMDRNISHKVRDKMVDILYKWFKDDDIDEDINFANIYRDDLYDHFEEEARNIWESE